MRYLLAVLQTVVAATFVRRWALAAVWIAALLSSFAVVGCGPVESTVNTEGTVADLKLVQEQLRPLCWEPPEVTAAKAKGDNDIFFAFAETTGEAITSRDRWVLDQALYQDGFVFKYAVDAPLENLRLVPLSRAADGWCSRIPRPTDKAALKQLNPCAEGASTAALAPATKNLLGQTEVSPYSPFFCEKRPRMAPTTQESVSLLGRNIAYQSAYEQAKQIAKALTQAEAEMQAVINKSDGWLKRALTEDPGSIEQIQQRVADQLNLIEAFPEYDDPILEMLALAGFNAGFDDGKFEVQAKLFAIDAGIFILEMVALEVALGPLGGAKAIVSVVGKGAKAVTTVAAKGSELFTTKGGQALVAAMKRLENIPLFIPGAAGGLGGAVRAGEVFSSLTAKMHRKLLEDALKYAKDPLVRRLRQAGESLHHIVAHTEARAAGARKILDKFKINVDEAWNGVFLPATLKSPNATGAAVHSVVHTTEYYNKVEKLLEAAKTRKQAIRILQDIRKALENGTF